MTQNNWNNVLVVFYTVSICIYIYMCILIEVLFYWVGIYFNNRIISPQTLVVNIIRSVHWNAQFIDEQWKPKNMNVHNINLQDACIFWSDFCDIALSSHACLVLIFKKYFQWCLSWKVLWIVMYKVTIQTFTKLKCKYKIFLQNLRGCTLFVNK